MFGLLKYFSVASAVVLCAAVAGLVALYRQSAEDALIYLTETQNTILAHSLVNAVWPRFSDYVDATAGYEPETLADRPEPREIHRTLVEVTAGLPVLKIKAYSLDGTTIYSTEPLEIGENSADNPHYLAIAAAGRPTSTLIHTERFAAFTGIRENLDVVETYVPGNIRNGPVSGVFELYADVTPQMAKIRSTTNQLLLGLVIAFGLLYAGLLLIVRRADRKLRAQYTKLESEVRRRKLAEEKLRAARDVALEASEAKSAFLANMSHELRTPLNAVIGFSEIIADETFGPVNPRKYREYAADIRRAGSQLLALVDNVLDLAKIEAGEMEIFAERFNICAVMDDVCAALKPIINRNGNRFELGCAQHIGWITSDESKLRSILINLLGNAAKFTENGIISLVVDRQGDSLVMRIADSGIGIDPDKVDSLFREFKQADGAVTTRRFGGSGLGLAICRKFCESLGGEISIASRAGQGTSVTVRLPDLALKSADLNVAV